MLVFAFITCSLLITSAPAKSWSCITDDRVSIWEYLSSTDYVFWSSITSREYQQGYWRIKAKVTEPLKGIQSDMKMVTYFRRAHTWRTEDPKRFPEGFQIIKEHKNSSSGALSYTGLKEPEWANEDEILFAGNIVDINHGKPPEKNILLYKNVTRCPPRGFTDKDLETYVRSAQYKYRNIIRTALLCLFAAGLFFGLRFYSLRNSTQTAEDSATSS